jgi:hypothetical protein
MKILEILLECLRCSAGEFLTDQAVLDMVTECFHVRSQQHSSKLLRRYAENVLMQMVLVLFARISPESSNANDLFSSRASSPSPVPMILGNTRSSSVGITGTGLSAPQQHHHQQHPLVSNSPSPYPRSSRSGHPRSFLSVHSTIKDWSTSTEMQLQQFNSGSPPAQSAMDHSYSYSSNAAHAAAASSASSALPYGIPALHRVFRFLTNLINPGDVRNSEQDRILGLRLIRTVLETSSARIGTFPPLIAVIQEELCKFLLQNSQTKNLFILSLTLRIVFDLFVVVKQHLKVQLEVFFTSIHLRIGESASSSPGAKELVLESLVEFCKEVSLIVGLYRNYDCEVGCTDLFQDLCKFLSQTAMQPWIGIQGMSGSNTSTSSISAGPSHLNLLAFEGMVAVLNAIVKRFCAQYQTHTHMGQLQNRQTGDTTSVQLSDSSRHTSGIPSHSLRQSPSSLTHSYSSHSFTGGTTTNSAIDYESDSEESTLLILNPEEEARLIHRRANKQKLALAAEQFNREGLTLKTVKFLQNLKILPPSTIPSTEESNATNGPSTITSLAGSVPSASPSPSPSPPTPGLEGGNVPTATTPTPSPESSSGGKRVKGPPPVIKSKHDFGVPPAAIVHFFRTTPGLDKAQIGSYLGDADPYNIKVLDTYVNTFDFSHVPRTMPPQSHNEMERDAMLTAATTADSTSTAAAAGTASTSVPASSSSTVSKPEISLDDALRSFLDGFKLPGEAQQIERIIERFSKAYYENCAGPLVSGDAAFVLCYSVIMLNTDAHNPQVQKKMTKDNYIRNLRGINGGKDLPRNYLENLFDSIVHNEIRIKGDSVKDLAFGNGRGGEDANASWNRVMASRHRRTGGGGADPSYGTADGAEEYTGFQLNAPRIHGREMFLLIWQQSISIFIYYLENCCAHRDGWMLNLQLAGAANASGGTMADAAAAASLSMLPGPHRSRAPSLSITGGTPTSPFTSSSITALRQEHLKVLPKIIQGLSLFCRICAVYSLNDLLNNCLIALCKALMGFLEELALEVNWDPKEIAIGFARDLRITHLLTLLFQLVHEYGESHILEGWSNVVHVLLWLREMELLPECWPEMEDFRDSTGKPLESVRFTSENTHLTGGRSHAVRKAALARQAKEAAAASNSSGGLGSFFSWGGFFRTSHTPSTSTNTNENNTGAIAAVGPGSLTNVNASPPVPAHTATELYWLAKAKEIISLCNIPQLFEDSKYFRASTLAHLVRSLIVVSSAGTKSVSSVSLNSYSPHILHEESAVFCLERLADVIEKNQARLNHEQQIQAELNANNLSNPIATPASPATAVTPAPPSTNTNSATSSLHLWSTIAQHFELSIANVRNDPACTFYIERLVVNLLRFSVRLVYSAETTSQLIALLALLLQLPKATFSALGQRIIAGTSLFLQTHGESIRSIREWEIVLSLLGQFKHHQLSAHAAFTTFVYAVDNHANMDTFAPLVAHLTRFMQPAEGDQGFMPVAPEAVISLLLKLHGKLATLSVPEPLPPTTNPPSNLSTQLHNESISQRALLSPAQIAKKQQERERMRTDLWLGSVQNFCNIIRAETRSNVRKAALDALNNCLLASGMSPDIPPLGWRLCFEKLLLPLLESVQKIPPEMLPLPSLPSNAARTASKSGARGPPEATPTSTPFDVRLKAATLVFQSFLHHLGPLTSLPDFPQFWLMFIGSMKRLMQGTSPGIGSAALDVHFTEGLRNLLLVMHSSGSFDAVTQRTGQNVLGLTWTVIDSFRPELSEQLKEHIKATSNMPPSRTVKLEQPPVKTNATPGFQPQQVSSQQQPVQQQPSQQQQMQFRPGAYQQQFQPSSHPQSAIQPTQPHPSPPQAVPATSASKFRAPSPIDFANLAPLSNAPMHASAHDLTVQAPPNTAAATAAGQFNHSRASQFQPISPIMQSAQVQSTPQQLISPRPYSPKQFLPMQQLQQQPQQVQSLHAQPPVDGYTGPLQPHTQPQWTPGSSSSPPQPGSEQHAQQLQTQQMHFSQQPPPQQPSAARPPLQQSMPPTQQQFVPGSGTARPAYGMWQPPSTGVPFVMPPSLPGPLPPSFPMPPPFPSVTGTGGGAMPTPFLHHGGIQTRTPAFATLPFPQQYQQRQSNGMHPPPPLAQNGMSDGNYAAVPYFKQEPHIQHQQYSGANGAAH